jgi:hypothetical protein
MLHSEVTQDDIAEIVSKWTGIPVSSLKARWVACQLALPQQRPGWEYLKACCLLQASPCRCLQASPC